MLGGRLHYTLHFEPDLQRSRFSGSAVIDAVFDTSTKNITMNAAELSITGCKVSSAGAAIKSRTRLAPGTEELIITLGRPVRGRTRIALEFDGVLNDRLLGFYSSGYVSGKKKMRIATTQFEAADARRAFPCWDEPSAKATFDVSITAPKDMRAISNMPVTKKVTSRGVTAYTFARTPPMPTYLLYLGVGDFESISATYRKIKISVIATRGKAKQGRFALGLAKKLLARYERYFGIRYPLPKLDLLAIPDFAAGAMENWGAITFRENLLLYDQKHSSTRTKQLIAEVVSHEIAHQWFGNLVTMKWWNDLWLNESFATFMATKFVDMLYPKWAMWEQFADDTVNAALRLDSLKSTHPIDVKVTSPAQIREIFDAISYDKGGSILQMIERVVGEPAFRRGLRRYLKKYAYANAAGEDLWREIGRSAKKDIAPFVHSWIRQPGYPLLDVRQHRRAMRVSQSRFYLAPPKRRSTQTWKIPVFVQGNRGAPALVSAKSATLPSAIPGVINPGRAAFIRVRYEEAHLDELRRAAAAGKMKSIDAWMIQNDIFALCRAGLYGIRTYLDFADACREQSYLVSSGVARNLRFLHRLSFGRPFEWRLRERSLEHHARMHARLGWTPIDGEHHVDSMLRGEVILTLGNSLCEPRIILDARSRFERFLHRPGLVAADLRTPVCSIAVASGGSGTWNRAKSLYGAASSQEERMQFLASMCAATDAGLLRRTLDFSQTRHVRSQDMHVPVMRIAANPHGSALVWPWLKKNWSSIGKKVGRGNPLLSRMISSVGIASSDARVASDLESFFSKRRVPGTERVVAQTAEAIRINSGLYDMMGRELGALG